MYSYHSLINTHAFFHFPLRFSYNQRREGVRQNNVERRKHR